MQTIPATANMRTIRGTHRRFQMPASPPSELPRYRLLTGKDDASFCRRVSEALDLGYQLYGSPAATFNGEHVVVAQAVLWPMKGRAAADENPCAHSD